MIRIITTHSQAAARKPPESLSTRPQGWKSGTCALWRSHHEADLGVESSGERAEQQLSPECSFAAKTDSALPCYLSVNDQPQRPCLSSGHFLHGAPERSHTQAAVVPAEVTWLIGLN